MQVKWSTITIKQYGQTDKVTCKVEALCKRNLHRECWPLALIAAKVITFPWIAIAKQTTRRTSNMNCRVVMQCAGKFFYEFL